VATSPSAERISAEHWFLVHGLPSVLRPGALFRNAWQRSAPALTAGAVVALNSVLVVAVTGEHTVDIHGTPTRSQWFVLLFLLLVLPVATLTGWSVSKINSLRGRGIVSATAISIILLSSVWGGPSPHQVANLSVDVGIVAVILLFTVTGIGSILDLAATEALSNLKLARQLFFRALPVVLLTVLVFFNTLVWTMAATVSRGRLWLALLFLYAVAAAFLISATMDQVRPILRPDAKVPGDDARLEGTPFETLPDRPRRVQLSRLEVLNVVVVVAVSQILHVLTVAVVTAAIFLLLGLILLSPEVVALWTHNGSTDGQVLGMTLPIPEALIQTTMFLAALTFMYLSARVVDDPEQRTQFVDPIIDNLRLALVARDRYRTFTAVPKR
jgi:hypothetical protein